jgi:hypothetical protein
MGQFLEANVVELRIYENPANPANSGYKVSLPITALEAVVDQTTGESLIQLFAKQSGGLGDHIANADVHVTPEWKTNIQQAIGDLIEFSQRDDIFVTPEDKARWNEAAATAITALALAQLNEGDITDINGRVAQIEDSLFNGITANPFTVSFDSLDGLNVARGIWNATARRVEC